MEQTGDFSGRPPRTVGQQFLEHRAIGDREFCVCFKFRDVNKVRTQFANGETCEFEILQEFLEAKGREGR